MNLIYKSKLRNEFEESIWGKNLRYKIEVGFGNWIEIMQRNWYSKMNLMDGFGRWIKKMKIGIFTNENPFEIWKNEMKVKVFLKIESEL